MKRTGIPAFKISYLESSDKPRLSLPDKSIVTSRQAASAFMELYSVEECALAAKEYCYALMVNNTNKPIGYTKISEGGIAGTVIDNRLVIKAALDVCATGVILCHNHPSGSPIPGKSDIEMTGTLRKACELMDIRLIDHIILATDSFFSFSEEKVRPIIL